MAAGRISVHLCKTSWPPGRGSRVGQTRHLEAVAGDSAAWHRATLGQGALCSPLLVTQWLRRHKVLYLVCPQLLPTSWSIHRAPAVPTAAVPWDHQWGWVRARVLGAFAGSTHGAGTPQTFGGGCGSHVPRRDPASSSEQEAPGLEQRGLGGPGGQRCQPWLQLCARSSCSVSCPPESGASGQGTGWPVRAHRYFANSPWQQH